jgi:hypothetical protein
MTVARLQLHYFAHAISLTASFATYFAASWSLARLFLPAAHDSFDAESG